MASPIGASGSFAVKVDDEGTSIDIAICEPSGLRSEGLSLSTWGASFILANLLHSIDIPSSPSGCRLKVLELGAGTGLVGLSAAAIWERDVILTDLQAIVPGLTANIKLNRKVFKQAGVSVAAGSLDWTDPSDIILASEEEKADRNVLHQSSENLARVILAADTIYDEDHPDLLTSTITRWLARSPESRVVFCYPLRMAYIDHVRSFWDRMEAEGLECCNEGQQKGDETWNEVAHTPYEWCVWRWKDLR